MSFTCLKCSNVLHRVALQCVALYCTVFSCVALYCAVLLETNTAPMHALKHTGRSALGIALFIILIQSHHIPCLYMSRVVFFYAEVYLTLHHLLSPHITSPHFISSHITTLCSMIIRLQLNGLKAEQALPSSGHGG